MAIALAILGCLSLGIVAEEGRQQAVEHERAAQRQLELLDVQRIRQSEHQQGWSRTMWERIAGMTWSPKERCAVQVQAVSSLSGIDVRIDKELRVYAQALAFAPDGRLWLGHTGGIDAMGSRNRSAGVMAA